MLRQFSDFTWRLLANRWHDKGQFTTMKLSAPGPVSLRAAEDCERADVLSVREVGDNGGWAVTQYLKATGLGPGNPWCMAFQVFREIEAAHETCKPIPDDFPRTASCGALVSWAKRKGWWISRAEVELGRAEPMQGDLVFYWALSRGGIYHVGRVEEVVKENGHIVAVWTVEGNTGPDRADGTVESNGQGVYKRYRTLQVIGLLGGFARLPF